MASNKSHWFQSSRPQALLIAAVARIPNEADSVTAMGLVRSCDHIAPHLVVLQRLKSAELVISVAVLPIPELIAYTKNQPRPLVALTPDFCSRWCSPIWPPVLTIQKMNRPNMHGI